ncbi:hypothetical protein AB0K51_19145 [Kitasatospora sp. NPDC049285]
MLENSQLFWLLLSCGVPPALWGAAIVLDRLYFTPYLDRLDPEEDCHE